MTAYSGATVFVGPNRAAGQDHIEKVLAEAQAEKPLVGLAGVKVGDTIIESWPHSHRRQLPAPATVAAVKRKYLTTTGGVEYVIATGQAKHGTATSRAETQEQHADRFARLEVQRDLGCVGVETLRARLTTDQLKRILAIAQEEAA